MTEDDKRKRLDEAGLEDGDAIIMETTHGAEWTVNLEAITLGQRNQPKAQCPKIPVFTEEQLAKYRRHKAGIKTTLSEIYPPQDGDITIRTRDNFLFGVHRFLLKLASPTMIDMFAIDGNSADQAEGTSCLSVSG